MSDENMYKKELLYKLYTFQAYGFNLHGVYTIDTPVEELEEELLRIKTLKQQERTNTVNKLFACGMVINTFMAEKTNMDFIKAFQNFANSNGDNLSYTETTMLLYKILMRLIDGETEIFREQLSVKN